jgi:hypothetical protein
MVVLFGYCVEGLSTTSRPVGDPAGEARRIASSLSFHGPLRFDFMQVLDGCKLV